MSEVGQKDGSGGTNLCPSSGVNLTLFLIQLYKFGQFILELFLLAKKFIILLSKLELNIISQITELTNQRLRPFKICYNSL